MQVGFIGLGTMGAHMARNLQKAGTKLLVHDARRAAAERHLAGGAIWAETPRNMAEQCEVVFTSLPGPPEVEAVALGSDGLLSGMRKGAAYFDLSTNSPTVVRRICAAFAERGVHLLDAPVSGGPKGAESGKLALWVGGERAIFDRHKALLDAMGDRARYVGPIGAGSVAKLVHNCAGYALQTVLAEVFTLGVKGGVEPLTVWDALKQSVGDTFVCRHDVPSIFAGHYDPSFTLDLCCKDLDLLAGLGQDFATDLPMTRAAHERFREARNEYGGDAAELHVCKLIEEQAGISLRVSGEWPIHSEA